MSPLLQALSRAWQATVTKAQSGQISSNSPEVDQQNQPAADPFWKRRVVGPVRVWHAGTVAGALGLGLVAVKKHLFSRLFGG